MINSKNKGKMFAAVGGAIVGAGAVLAGAMAMSDKKNQEKVKQAFDKGKDEGKTNIKKVANKAIKSAEKVTKMAKMKVRKI